MLALASMKAAVARPRILRTSRVGWKVKSKSSSYPAFPKARP